jgi:hypothetical protein
VRSRGTCTHSRDFSPAGPPFEPANGDRSSLTRTEIASGLSTIRPESRHIRSGRVVRFGRRLFDFRMAGGNLVWAPIPGSPYIGRLAHDHVSMPPFVPPYDILSRNPVGQETPIWKLTVIDGAESNSCAW